MNKELWRIHGELVEMSEKEATKLFRLAWRMVAHGCDPKHIEKCREEARELHMNAYPERMLNPSKKWEYAFRF